MIATLSATELEAVTSGPTHAAAHQIAIAHFLYNVLGVLIIFGIPWLRNIPVAGAEWITELASTRKSLAIIYTLGVFFGHPGRLVGVISALV